MEIENERIRAHLAERGIVGVTVGLMSAADRDMRSALRGVDGEWVLEFSWELSQAVASLVEITELEQYARQQRAQLINYVTGTLSNLTDRPARRRALKLLRRLERDAGVVAGRARRPQVADPVGLA